MPADSTASDGAAEVARDVSAETGGTDVAADTAPPDVARDVPNASDASGDTPTIAPNCAVRGQYAASVGIGGSGPTVAYSAPLFGVVWKAAANDLLYNAVSESGTLQLGADKTVVSGTTQGVNTPRLARLGADFALAYGRHDGSGAQAGLKLKGRPVSRGVAPRPSARAT